MYRGQDTRIQRPVGECKAWHRDAGYGDALCHFLKALGMFFSEDLFHLNMEGVGVTASQVGNATSPVEFEVSLNNYYLPVSVVLC